MNYVPKTSACETGLSRACALCVLTECAFHDLDGKSARQKMLGLGRGDRLESRDSKGCLQFWVVVNGTAATCTSFEDGRRQIIGLERPGDIICALMAGNGTQNWLEALSDCTICEIDLSPFAGKLRHDPEFMAATFAITHRRLTRSQAHISTLGRLDSRERVLLFLAEKAVQANSAMVTLHMSREDIADYLGLNAETVSRMLSQIKKSGLVKFLSRTEYVVPDLEKVARHLPVAVPGTEQGEHQ